MPASRILVVDDEPFIRTTVSMLLRLEGYDVDSAPDGRAGLQQALDRHPAVILSDLHMPLMDGQGLLQAVRAEATLADVRFVLLTGAVESEAAAGTATQPDARLAKPFTREQLLGVLRSFDL